MTDRSGEPADTWTVSHVVRTMFPLLIALSVLEMGSGLVLEELEGTYLDNPTLLVLVPVMIGMGGNLGAILSARLSTRLHLGMLSFDPGDDDLRTNVAAILSMAATIFVLLGVAAWVVGLVVADPMALSTLLTITVVSGLSLTVVVVLLSVGATYVSYRLGLDPDDTTIPVVTNVGDVLGVLILSGVALVVL